VRLPVQDVEHDHAKETKESFKSPLYML